LFPPSVSIEEVWTHFMFQSILIVCAKTRQRPMCAHGCFWVGRAGTLASPRLGGTHLLCNCYYLHMHKHPHPHRKGKGKKKIWTPERHGVFTSKSAHQSLNDFG